MDYIEKVKVDNGMAIIPSGSFILGDDNWGEFEKPAHKVHLDNFLIDKTPVTNYNFESFVESTGYITTAEKAGGAWGYKSGKFQFINGLSWKSFSDEARSEHPVILVSWYDAEAYCNWIGKRLPTEIEWEKTARGGNFGYQYPWGNELPNGSQCNFANEPNETPPTTSVFKFSPNNYGVYDLVGNVWQWCDDWFDKNKYLNKGKTNSNLVLEKKFKSRRGGSWNVIQPFRLRSANRGAADPIIPVTNIGFRCAKDISNEDAKKWMDALNALKDVLPAMQADGGGCEIFDIQNNTIFVKMMGTCLGCPSIDLSLKIGIEQTLKSKLSWLEEVRRV